MPAPEISVACVTVRPDESVTNNLFGDNDGGVSARSPAKLRFPVTPIAVNRVEKF